MGLLQRLRLREANTFVEGAEGRQPSSWATFGRRPRGAGPWHAVSQLDYACLSGGLSRSRVDIWPEACLQFSDHLPLWGQLIGPENLPLYQVAPPLFSLTGWSPASSSD